MNDRLKKTMASKKSADDQQEHEPVTMDLGSGVILKCVSITPAASALFIYRKGAERLPRGIIEYVMPVMPSAVQAEIFRDSLEQGYLRERVLQAIQECLLDEKEMVAWNDGSIVITKE